MYILFFDDDKKFAEYLKAEWLERFRKIDHSCICVVLSDVDVLLLTDLSIFQAIFLCVDMPGLEGMDIAFAIRKRCPDVLLILVSKELLHAPDGYYINAFRFLLKEKIKKEFAVCIDDVTRQILKDQGLIKIKGKDCWREINVAEILYIEGSANRKIYFHMKSLKTIEAKGKLADYTESLRDQGFLRIQRGYLVNMRHIAGIKSYYVFLDSGEKLKASTQKYAMICKQFEQWKMRLKE